MPRRSDKKCSKWKEKKSLNRSCVQSMGIPPSSSKRTSLSSICSSQQICFQPQGQSSETAASCKELFCTSETCSNSESCFKSSPEFCPFGLKKDEEKQCTACHINSNTTKGLTKKKTMNSKHNMTTLDNERQDESKHISGHLPAAIQMSTLNRSNSLLDKRMSSNESIMSSVKSSPCSSTPCSPPPSSHRPCSTSPCTPLPCSPSPCKDTQSRRKESKTSDTTPINTKTSGCADSDVRKHSKTSDTTPFNTKTCCADDDAMLQTRNLTDNETHPIPDSSPAETDMFDMQDTCRKCDSCTSITNEATNPLNSSLTNIPRRSSIRTSFQLPVPETEPSIKCQPMPADFDKADDNRKSLSCPCTETKEAPPVQKKCSCHFPAAFNQFGCTGNINGSCNCCNDDSQ